MPSLSLQQNHSSLADRLAKRIRTKLQSKPVREGDVFMTEAQVAIEFDVSRTIVREAVSRLRALGILEGRQGKGLVARRPDLIQLISESVPSLAGSEEDFRDLIELRYVLEVGGIELAVANATPVQIEQLHQIAEKFAQAVESSQDAKQQIPLDLKFHTLLLEMTHSTLIAGLNKVLARFFEAHVVRNFEANGPGGKTTKQHREETAKQHFEIVSAIEQRDVERARYVIRSHIHCYLRHLSTVNQLSEKGLSEKSSVAAADRSASSAPEQNNSGEET